MQRQYREFREKLPAGTILLFRLGDFYEVFGEDAVVASKVLGLTLTKRHETPMAGLPYHAAPAYVNRLLAAGWKPESSVKAGLAETVDFYRQLKG